eukprot:6509449-Prymnesium_polylepis.1
MELGAAADVARPRPPASCVCSASAAAAPPSLELSQLSIAIAAAPAGAPESARLHAPGTRPCRADYRWAGGLLSPPYTTLAR